MTHASSFALTSIAKTSLLTGARRCRRGVTRVARLTALLLVWCVVAAPPAALAEDIRNPQSAVDYRLRTEAHIDPTTGALQFQLNLGNYPGRAGLNLPVTLY